METENKPYRIQIAILFVSVVLVMTGFGIIFPILPKVLGRYDAGAVQLGILAALYGIFVVLFSPFFGYLADKIGKKPVILIGLFGFSGSNLIYVFANEVWEIGIARSLEGIFAASIFPVALAITADLVDEKVRSKYIGYISSANAIGLVIGPLLGGWLFSYSPNMPFIVSAILAFLAGSWALIELQSEERNVIADTFRYISNESTDPTVPTKKGIALLFAILPAPLYAFTFFVIIDMINSMSWILVEPGFSFYIYDNLHLTPWDFGTFVASYGACLALGQVFLGGISDTYGRRLIIFIGVFLNLVFFLFLGIVSTLGGLMLLAALAGVSGGLMIPALKALLTDISPVKYRASIFGIESGLMNTGTIIGPIVGGYLYDFYSMQFVINISCILVAFSLFLVQPLKFGTPKIPVEKKSMIVES